MPCSPALTAAIADQIACERLAHATYLQVGTWFDAEGLEGFAAHWDREADEEVAHLRRLIHHARDLGCDLALGDVPAPPPAFDSPGEAVAHVYRLERQVTACAQALVAAARADGDEATALLGGALLTAQVATEKALITLMQRIARSATLIDLIDLELQEEARDAG